MSGPFTHQHASNLATAAMLALTRAADALSDFERSLLSEVAERFLRNGTATVVTAEEYAVVMQACDGMIDVLWPKYLVEVLPPDPATGRGGCQPVPRIGRA